MEWLAEFLPFIFIMIFFFILPAMMRRQRGAELERQFSRIQRKRKSRIIAIVHRQEPMGLLGIPVLRYIDLNDAEDVLEPIRTTPQNTPIAFCAGWPIERLAKDDEKRGWWAAFQAESFADTVAYLIQQGGNPQEIMLFLQGIGQHVQDHLARLSTDPTRRPQVEAYAQQLQMLVQTVEQLGQMLADQQQAMAQQQQAMAIQQGVDPRTAVMNEEVQAKIARQNAETMANIQRQNTKAMADLARRNAKTTADIQRANATAESNLARQG